MKKEIKQFIADKYAKKFLKENRELLDDYKEICEELLFFHAKWGIEIGVILKNPQENKGRQLGKGYSPAGITEELFDAQKTINKIEKYSKDKFRDMTDKEIKIAKKKPFIKIF